MPSTDVMNLPGSGVSGLDAIKFFTRFGPNDEAVADMLPDTSAGAPTTLATKSLDCKARLDEMGPDVLRRLVNAPNICPRMAVRCSTADAD